MSISHITSKLISPALSPELDVLFSSLSPRDAIKYVQDLEHANKSKGDFAVNSEEQALYDAMLGRLVAAVYTEALDILLAEAIEAESESEWWADLGRSRLSVAHYLLQSILSSNVSLSEPNGVVQPYLSAWPVSLEMCSEYCIPTISLYHSQHSSPRQFVAFLAGIQDALVQLLLAYSHIFTPTLDLYLHRHLRHSEYIHRLFV